MLSKKDIVEFGEKLSNFYFYNRTEDNVEEIASKMAKEELNECSKEHFHTFKRVYDAKIRTFKYWEVYAVNILDIVYSPFGIEIYVDDEYYVQEALEQQGIPYVYHNCANGVQFFKISKKDFDKVEKNRFIK